jgi:hypothetical protein
MKKPHGCGCPQRPGGLNETSDGRSAHYENCGDIVLDAERQRLAQSPAILRVSMKPGAVHSHWFAQPELDARGGLPWRSNATACSLRLMQPIHQHTLKPLVVITLSHSRIGEPMQSAMGYHAPPVRCSARSKRKHSSTKTAARHRGSRVEGMRTRCTAPRGRRLDGRLRTL